MVFPSVYLPVVAEDVVLVNVWLRCHTLCIAGCPFWQSESSPSLGILKNVLGSQPILSSFINQDCHSRWWHTQRPTWWMWWNMLCKENTGQCSNLARGSRGALLGPKISQGMAGTIHPGHCPLFSQSKIEMIQVVDGAHSMALNCLMSGIVTSISKVQFWFWRVAL